MAIFAVNEQVLNLFNDLLHDLYFESPLEGFTSNRGTITITFLDKDCCIHKDMVAEYQLCIHDVLEVETKGSLEQLPGNEVELNEIDFVEKEPKKVILRCVHPFRLICTVARLRLSLDQL